MRLGEGRALSGCFFPEGGEPAAHSDGLRGKSRGVWVHLPWPALEDMCIMALKAGQLWAVYCLTHLLFICIYLVPSQCQELCLRLRV